MGYFLYSASLLGYQLAANIAALFNPKAKAFVEGRKDLMKRISIDLKGNNASIIWVHCASLGEFEQGRPVMEALRAAFPTHKIFLTFYSPSGYEVRKDYDGADYIYYLPWDTHQNAERLVKILQPKLLIIVKYEFWHHMISACQRHKVPVLSTSSIFRPNQLFFKNYGAFYRRILKNVDHFFVQNPLSKKLLEQIGIKDVSISGDTRFDRVVKICDQRNTYPLIENFKNNQPLLVVGSCWPEDLDVLTAFINGTDIKFIIAPHEISDKFINKIEEDLTRATVRYSSFDESSQAEVLIIDNIGMLSSLYAYADYAYVGGAFGAGLHNILEPATFGIPIFFGNKNYQKFKEANDLINLGGAVAVGSFNELKSQFQVLSEPTTYNIIKQVNTDYVRDHTGATEQIIDHCKKILEQ